MSHVLLMSSAYLAYDLIISLKFPGGGSSIYVPPFNSMRHTSSLPTQTCTCGGSKPFSLVLTTKRNCPSMATVGICTTPRHINLLDTLAVGKVYHITIHFVKTYALGIPQRHTEPCPSLRCRQRNVLLHHGIVVRSPGLARVVHHHLYEGRYQEGRYRRAVPPACG